MPPWSLVSDPSRVIAGRFALLKAFPPLMNWSGDRHGHYNSDDRAPVGGLFKLKHSPT